MARRIASQRRSSLDRFDTSFLDFSDHKPAAARKTLARKALAEQRRAARELVKLRDVLADIRKAPG